MIRNKHNVSRLRRVAPVPPPKAQPTLSDVISLANEEGASIHYLDMRGEIISLRWYKYARPSARLERHLERLGFRHEGLSIENSCGWILNQSQPPR